MLKGHIILLLLGCIILGTDQANAQTFNPDNFVIKRWGMEEGLPQSSVNNIQQTEDGYLWLATFGGLVRFDGHTFKTFDRSNTPGLRSDRIISLYEDKNAKLWVSTEDGFYRFEGDKVLDFSIIRNGQVYPPLFIKNDEFNDLWVMVDSDPYRLVEDEFVKMQPITSSENLETIIADDRGIWMVLGKKVAKTFEGEVYLIKDFQQQIGSKLYDVVEYPKGSGVLFMATWNDGIVRLKGDDFQFYNENHGLPSGFIWQLYVDSNNMLWVTASNGQSIWVGDHFEIANIDGIHDKYEPKIIKEDNNGNFWFGTVGNGLIRARRSLFQNIDADNGLNFTKMLSLHKTQDDQFLFGTNCDGVYEWENNKASPSNINKYLENNCIWSVFKDSKGNYWFGSFELYKTNSLDEPGRIIGEGDGFYGFDVYAITEDSFGRIWIGSFNGVHVYENGTFTRYNTDNGLAYNDTRYFYEDENQTMWLGSSSGLSTIDKSGTVRQFNLISNKADSNSDKVEPYVRAIHKDADGIMWIGTYGNGIYRIENNSILNITEEDGLFDNIVSHIIEDEKGNFWIGSNRGVFSVQKHDLNALARNEIETVPTYSFGIADGMNSAETNGGFQPNVIYDEEGKIYFPTVEGVAVLDTDKVNKSNDAPKVIIEQIQTSSEVLTNAKNIELPYNESFLQIDYTAINLTNPEKVVFRYKIDGFHNDWIEVGNNRQAIFSKITPGNYSFTVSASLGNGIWNEIGDSIAISISPPFWQTIWFYSFLVILFIAVVPVSFYLRTKQLREENERQKRFSEELINSQEAERRRIASELHDSLGQQILVIKNRAELAKISYKNTEGLVDQLDEIVMSAKSSIDSVRAISHNLRPVHLEKFGLTEAIESLCMEMQRSTNIDWAFQLENIDSIIPKDKEITFYRVIQEAFNNILKHSEATEASIKISILPEKAIVSIADNGKGFNADKIGEISNLGFLGMKERLESLGGSLSVISHPGKGTILTLRIASRA
ncbi:MAG: hypothetical protein JJ895_01895 [Balneolaceae bacterium]|nr:hypothetical protein [Balneolaceae bacterium]